MTELDADRVRAIESLVADWLHDDDVPGASVVVVDADGERYAEGFGARDLETNAPATPDTLFGMGSISKSVTSVAVVQLDEAGALSLDDPVDDYVDHFADAPGEPITVADLLSHTSGMPSNDPGLIAQALEGVPAGVADADDFERWVRDSVGERVTDESRYLYYNVGYDVLGAVIEAVDGRPYTEYVREEVLDPLGMERSTFDPDRLDSDDDAMTGYRPGEDAPDAAPFPLGELSAPAGGLISSAREFSRFLRAAMTDGSLDDARVCSTESLARLQEPRAVRQTYLDGTEQRYGYGWMRAPLGDDEWIGHGGSILVGTAFAGFLADAGLGVVVACNTTADPHPMEIGQGVLAVATGREPTAVPALALEAKCEAVTGTYESFREGVTATVERADGGLELTLSGSWGEEEVPLFPRSLDPEDHAFYTVSGAGARLPVEFDLDGDRADCFYTRFRLRRTGEAT